MNIRAANPQPSGRTVPAPTWGPVVDGLRTGPTITVGAGGLEREAEAGESKAPPVKRK